MYIKRILLCLCWIEPLEYFSAADDAEHAVEEASENVCTEPACTSTDATEETARSSDELASNSPTAASGTSYVDAHITDTSEGHIAESGEALANPAEDNKVCIYFWTHRVKYIFSRVNTSN